MLTLHGIQMQDVWPPVARLEVKARVTNNDETPMQGIMDGDQKEVLAEDIYPLHINGKTKVVMIMTLRMFVQIVKQLQCVRAEWVGYQHPEPDRAKEAYFGPRLDSQVVPLCRCQSFDSIIVWRAFAPCTYKASACWFSVSPFAIGKGPSFAGESGHRQACQSTW